MTSQTRFLQVPPTGFHPQAAVQRPDLAWIYHWDKGWRPVTDESWHLRHLAGHRTEFIPGFDMTDREPLEPKIKELIAERPNEGCLGLWCRDVFNLKAEGGIVHTGIFGLFWHPEPTALASCQAQAIQSDAIAFVGNRFNEPRRDLTWQPYASFEELWAAIPRL